MTYLRFGCFTAILATTCLAAAASERPDQPHPETNQDSPLMLDLSGMEIDAGQIDFAALPHVPSQHVILSDVRDRSGTWVHQHAYLTFHDGRFWAMWSDGPGMPRQNVTPAEHRNVVPGHDQPGNRVSFATSVDGVNWTAPADLSGPPENNGVRIARGFWVREGELLALTAYWTGPGWVGLKLDAYRWDEKNESWTFRGMVRDDSMNNFPPRKLPTGDYLMTRRDHRRQVSVMIGGVEGFDQWSVRPLAGYGDDQKPEEPYWYVLPDGKNIVGLVRDNARSGRLLRTFSTDHGRSWSRLVTTNFPDATSKFFVLRTSRGDYVMVSNANPERRDPLTLAVSRDGLVFDRLYYLVGGRHVDYPHIIEHNEKLMIAFSGAKQTMEVLTVSLDDLERMGGGRDD